MSNNNERINMWFLDIRGISFAYSHFENISFIDTDISDVYFDELEDMKSVSLVSANSGGKNLPFELAWALDPSFTVEPENGEFDVIQIYKESFEKIMAEQYDKTVKRLIAFGIRSGKFSEDEVKGSIFEGIDRIHPQ
jgi:hypothetical protein